ncbi:anaphase-promoting complex subunit 7 [Macrosteles quadrilineatus]|uniref:anaphase-promoting complex subunit 7 n=1 Tax=Macrosteles quadrilineatus TaxID=74068 RepID=UPI0023E11725|nr:anaphase-promoting complex subunit 7 [Macrosteles quadrilineatus]
MASTPYDQIKLLYDQELYSNVVSLANLVLTVSDYGNDILNPSAKFQTYVHYGDSLLQLGRYAQAVAVYKQALQFKKSMLKSKNVTKPNETIVKDLMPDTDIKYQIHQCLVKMNRNDEAMEVLQSIPVKQRTAKINFALAKLLQCRGMERSAVSAYKEVLRECPLALEAVEGLLSLTVSGAEVNSLVIEANLTNMDWVNNWIKAHAHLYSKEFSQAINVLRQLDERTPLRGNHSLLVSLGEAYYYIGDNTKACNVLLRAHNANPTITRGLDVLASLLVGEHRLPELERLMPTYDPNLDVSHEVYTAIGYLMYANNNPSRAAYLAHKACLMKPHNVEALILKGRVLYDLKKYQDAVLHFREAQQAAQYRYEPYKGLVDCYVAQHRIREAVSFASNCCKQLNNTPRALTLYASVLMKDPVTLVKAKSLLEKALQQDESHLPAVYLLVQILEQEDSLEAVVALLEKQVTINPTSKLHQMLGDIYARINDEQKAFENYHISLNLDANNRRSMEGMQRLHASPSLSANDRSYYHHNMSDVEPEPSNDNVPDSDLEASSEISL